MIMKSGAVAAVTSSRPVTGDASVTGVRIAPGVAVTCGRRGAAAAINVVDPGFVVDPVDRGTPNQPHNPDRPR
jgi:hypothetical protein